MTQPTKKTIAVDLDGVIHVYSRGWHDGTMYDKAVAGSHNALADLVSRGFHVAIVTARLNPKYDATNTQRNNVTQWLSDHDYVVGKHYHELINNKPAALAYIDDRAIAFKTWDQTISDLQDLIPKKDKF